MQENTVIFMDCGSHEFVAPFVHDSAEAFGFLASPSARSLNSGYLVQSFSPHPNRTSCDFVKSHMLGAIVPH